MIVLEQLVTPDSFVDILPIDELGFKHVKPQSERRPPYNLATLLKFQTDPYFLLPARKKKSLII